MSNDESKPLDACSLFPAGCACFLHTLQKRAKVWHLSTPPTGSCVHKFALPVVWKSDEWACSPLGGLPPLWNACSLIYYTPKYKTAQPAAALISSSGICPRSPGRLPQQALWLCWESCSGGSSSVGTCWLCFFSHFASVKMNTWRWAEELIKWWRE